jgi:hypothetical protein
MTVDPDGPRPPGEAEAVARLRRAAAYAEDLDWPLTASDVIGAEPESGRARRPRWSRVAASRGARIAAALVVAAAIVVVFLVPLPLVHLGGRANIPSSPGRHTGGAPLACTTTVHGVVPVSSSVTAGYVPAGFRIVTQPSVQTGTVLTSPSVGYQLANGRPDPPRIGITLSNLPGPLTWAVGGRRTARRVRIQGRPALLETGPPSPASVGAYWKAGSSHLVSVVGYKLTAATVLEVAQHVVATPGGVVSLPLEPGRIVSPQRAIAAAEKLFRGHVSGATAKLSSWTEVVALLQASGKDTSELSHTAPVALTAQPWKPVWAVRMTVPGGQVPRPGFGMLAVLNAVTGASEILMSPGGHSSWFATLSDRDPTFKGCPGGSSARVPFGVLTRDEEAYAVRNPPVTAMVHLPATVELKLTTVPALNRADPGLYGGCVQQSCSIDELVWPTIAVIHAPAGRTLSCPPPWESTPPGGRTTRTKQYYLISVPDNYGSGCGPLPAWVSRLKDLAPAP